MVEYYVEPAGNDGNLGTAPGAGNAWLTTEHAEEAGALGAGDNVWPRRTHNEVPVSDIACAYDGGAGSPISLIGWPRAAIPDTTITGADWTNGSSVVDNVAGIAPTRTRHIGRYCTAPNGMKYLITAVLYEAGVDGMAGGSEFTVGSYATNTTQTKKGRIYGFTDNGDTTGIIQYTRDSSSAWVNIDNITDLAGGDAEIDAGGETAVGFIIDREYSGGTVTGVSGKFQIEADDDYATRPAAGIDAGWDGDADDLPVIDFNDGGFQLYVHTDSYNIFKNFEIKDSTDFLGIIYSHRSQATSLIGCLIKQSIENDPLIACHEGSFYLERVIAEGSGVGPTQNGLISPWSGGHSICKDCAFYNMGNNGIHNVFRVFLTSVNFGVEIANGDADIELAYNSEVSGRDVILGGKNGDVDLGVGVSPASHVSIENCDKILGAHKKWIPGGTIEKVAADGGGTRPNQRAGGYANVIEITPNIAGHEYIPDWAVPVFVHEYDKETATKTWRYYVQNDACGALAATNLWLKLKYVEQYDDTSEYVITEIISDETVNNRADNNDWTQYIEVPNITPATSSTVSITGYVSKHSAAGHIYIDSKVSNP